MGALADMWLATSPSQVETRSVPNPTPWAGWPTSWGTSWEGSGQLNKLVDTAWASIDKNASVLSTMPPYQVQGNRVISPPSWMANPDPDIYASWEEFAKQLFWDYQQHGETFILAMARDSEDRPLRFRVIPGWTVNTEMIGGRREYRIGGTDVTDDMLHIRYHSTVDCARGHGPLEAGGARMTAAAMLGRYVENLARTGGVPHYVVTVDKKLDKGEADDMLNQWVDSRVRNLGYPALVSGGNIDVKSLQQSAKDMALLELAQFSESRIAILLGLPPFLVGLPSGGDSMTYSNVSSLFDFHDRSALRPMAKSVMSALSNWALPRGRAIELNRDEYSRPAFNERADAYDKLIKAGVMSVEEVRVAERLTGEAPARALTGGAETSDQSPA